MITSPPNSTQTPRAGSKHMRASETGAGSTLVACSVHERPSCSQTCAEPLTPSSQPTVTRWPRVVSNAAAMLHIGGSRPQHDVLRELAEKFEQFVLVLNEVADGAIAQGAKGERGLLSLYERWLKTGSSRLAEELGARGLVPVRGKEGMN